MKKIENYLIKSNEPLTSNIYKLVLKGDSSWIKNPGQFINITIENCYLKRPISICEWDEESITCIYKVVGKGTEILSKLKENEHLEALVGLGNGFEIEKCQDEEVLLIGGGVGTPPIYGLAKACLKAHKKVKVILGFATKKDCFYLQEFEKLGVDLYISTNDGSLGVKGFVSDVIKQEKLENIFYMTCGPMAMMKAIYHTSNAKGLLSFEERMGCGFGACMGCSCQTITGFKRICTEGPVLESEELLWKD